MRHTQSVVDLAVQHVRLVRERDAGELPEGHADAAVDEALDVEAEDSRVELSTPLEVVEPRAGGAAVDRVALPPLHGDRGHERGVYQ